MAHAPGSLGFKAMIKGTLGVQAALWGPGWDFAASCTMYMYMGYGGALQQVAVCSSHIVCCEVGGG